MPEYTTPSAVMAQRVEDGTILLDLASGTYFRLNSTGSLVWSALERHQGVDEIVANIATECGASAELVRGDVTLLLAALVERGLLGYRP